MVSQQILFGALTVLTLMTSAATTRGGELGNLVVMLSDGKPSANRQSLPEIFCKLQKSGCARIVGAFVDRLGGGKKRITIIEQKKNKSDCHSCQASLSLYAYVQMNPRSLSSRWVLESKFINFARAGSWGAAAPSLFHIYKLNNKFRILYIKEGYMNQGVIEGGVSFYKFTTSHLKHIGTFFTTSISVYGIRDINLISNWEDNHEFKIKDDSLVLKFRIDDKLFGENTVSLFRLKGDKLFPIGNVDSRLRHR